MKTARILITALALSAARFSVAGLPPPATPLPPCANPPELDGVVSAAEWEDALLFDTFFAPGARPAAIATVGYVQRSATHLYAAWVCTEPEMDKIVMNHAVTDRDGTIWRDDCVELFIDVFGDGKSTRIYQFVINTANLVFDQRVDAGEAHSEWNSAIKVATWKGDDRWSAEVALPLAELGAVPNQVWGINLARERKVRDWQEVYSIASGDFGKSSVMYKRIIPLPLEVDGLSLAVAGASARQEMNLFALSESLDLSATNAGAQPVRLLAEINGSNGDEPAWTIAESISLGAGSAQTTALRYPPAESAVATAVAFQIRAGDNVLYSKTVQVSGAVLQAQELTLQSDFEGGTVSLADVQATAVRGKFARTDAKAASGRWSGEYVASSETNWHYVTLGDAATMNGLVAGHVYRVSAQVFLPGGQAGALAVSMSYRGPHVTERTSTRKADEWIGLSFEFEMPKVAATCQFVAAVSPGTLPDATFFIDDWTVEDLGAADKVGRKSRAWVVQNPKHEALFRQGARTEDHVAAFIWSHVANHEWGYYLGAQYGFHYSQDAILRELADRNIGILAASSWIDTSYRGGIGRHVRESGLKLASCMDHRTWTPVPFPGPGGRAWFIDPLVRKLALERMRRIVTDERTALVIEADEYFSSCVWPQTDYFLDRHRDDYPFLLEAEAEAKTRFGGGKYGFPANSADMNPFRRIVLQQYVVDAALGIAAAERKIIDEHGSGQPFVSFDEGGIDALDFSRWGEIFDIVTVQCGPSLDPNLAGIGFVTKWTKDLTLAKDVWPCAHVENYLGNFSAEEVREYLSQVVRNGGTGLHMYACNIIARRSGKIHFLYDAWGAPRRWAVWVDVVERLRTLPPLAFPTPDSAILFSNDSYAAQKHPRSHEVEWAYNLIGPHARGAFVFVDERILLERKRDIRDFKVVYVPHAKYIRSDMVAFLEDYVRAGGRVVVGDPEAFSYDLLGNDMSAARVRLVGASLGEPRLAGKVSLKVSADAEIERRIDVAASGFQIAVEANDTVVLGRYADGEPALVSRRHGEGEWLYFAFNPFYRDAPRTPAWQAFFTALHARVGARVDEPIWDFKFPRIELPQPPFGRCLTNNHVVWRAGLPTPADGVTAAATYTYSADPETIADRSTGAVDFAAGKLTNRKLSLYRPAVVADGKAAATFEPDSREWSVAWNKPPTPLDITVDLREPYPLRKITLFYTGAPGRIEVTSDDAVLGAAEAPASGDWDVLTCTVPCASETAARRIRIRMTPSGDGPLKLHEMEIWAE